VLGSFPFLAPAQRPDEIGRLGPYRVLGELGRGGMGVVFRAEDPALRRQVALKVMLPQFAADPGDRARFVREARAQAAVEHEHVAAIYQVGEDRGVAFLAMPLLRGQSLADALRANPRVPVGEAVRLAREVASGLAAAHERGLVHRDVKPGNIWLEGKGRRVKILDFGLARPSGAEAEKPRSEGEVTVRGAVIGTPAYMSPEQARGEGVDGRSDLFSLGAVLYQLLAGRQPFRAASTTGVLIAVATEHPVPPSAHNPSVPGALDALVMSLLGKNPAARPSSAEVVAEALAAIEGGLTGVIGGGATPMPAVVVSALPAAGGSGPDPWAALDDPTEHAEPVLVVAKPRRPEPPRAPRKPARIQRLLGGLIVLLALSAGALALFRPKPDEGTLVVEVADPEVEVRFRHARLLVFDRDGTERYAISPSERTKSIRSGSYTLRLQGGDGLVLDTQEISVSKGEQITVRVAQVSKPQRVDPRKDSSLPAGTEADRRAAEYVLGLGGTVRVNGEPPSAEIALSGDLPRGLFRLTAVNLSENDRITEGGLAVFRDCKCVLELSLWWSAVTDAGLAHFAGCEQLTHLNLKRNPQVGDGGIAHFRNCKQLKYLNLGGTGVTDAGLAVFGGCEALTTLGLWETRTTDAGLAHFRASKNLVAVNLSGTSVTDFGLTHLKDCANLELLWLSDTRTTDLGLAALEDCRKLRDLNLNFTDVSDLGVAMLRDRRALAQLRLNGTRVTDDALAAVAECRALKVLDLRKTHVTAAAVLNLSRNLPACQIDWRTD
jgi:hypothetical protein